MTNKLIRGTFIFNLKEEEAVEPLFGFLMNRLNAHHILAANYTNGELFEHYYALLKEHYASQGKKESLLDVSVLMKQCFTKAEELTEETGKGVDELMANIERLVGRFQLENLATQVSINQSGKKVAFVIVIEGETSQNVELEQGEYAMHKVLDIPGESRVASADEPREAVSNLEEEECMEAEFLTEQFLYFLRKAKKEESPGFKQLSFRLMGLSTEETVVLKESIHAAIELLLYGSGYTETPTFSAVKEVLYNDRKSGQILLSDYFRSVFEKKSALPSETVNHLTGMMHLQKHYVGLVQAEALQNAIPLSRESHLLLAVADIATWIEAGW